MRAAHRVGVAAGRICYQEHDRTPARFACRPSPFRGGVGRGKFTRADLEAACEIVHAAMPPTPQYAWPLLKARTGVDVVLKHENHTPTGSFKVRGGIVYADRLKRERPHVKGVITATRGNHRQSLAFACVRTGVACTVVGPFGNSTEKNAAMKAFGAELIEHGRDFDEAREHAE